ncbi:hypothetical protein AB0J82_09660 [Asanoa sp. NPDC049518]|uniref:hypothetical protein n=1 Tax=unclassified Asanoa TaxID=2685164 RepID=UPI00343BE2FA
MGFDVVAGLRSLDTYADVWRFIRSFAAEWAEPIREADDVTRAELDEAEQRLGVRLPEVIREAYQLIGNFPYNPEPYTDRFSINLVELVMCDAVEAGDRSDGRELTDYDRGLFDGFTPLSTILPAMEWNMPWHVSPDVILRRSEDLIVIAARTDEALAEFRVNHPGDWMSRWHEGRAFQTW